MKTHQIALLVAVVLFIGCVRADQIHLAYAGGGGDNNAPVDTIAVSWHSTDDIDQPTVQYGLDQDKLDMTNTGFTTWYYGESYHHHVVLGELKPSTKYYYQVEGDDRVLSFTSPSFDQPDKPLSIAMIGDMGVYHSSGTMDALNRVVDDVDFIYHLGDMSYADDSYRHHLEFYYEKTWDTYMSEIEEFTSKVAYMVLPGNHEATCWSPMCQLSEEKTEAFYNFSAYRHRFRMPNDESGGVDNMWYSFDVGRIHMISIDTETDYKLAPGDHYTLSKKNGGFGDQIGWLEADLKKAVEMKDAGETDWIVVGGHRPIYSRAKCSSSGKPKLAARTLQHAIEDLLVEYEVDVYYCGHIHGYERQYPTYKSEPIINGSSTIFADPEYPIHIVNGAAGNTENLEHSDGKDADWNAYYNYEDFGYGVLNVDGNTMEWKYYDDSDNLLDEFTIVKSTIGRRSSPIILE